MFYQVAFRGLPGKMKHPKQGPDARDASLLTWDSATIRCKQGRADLQPRPACSREPCDFTGPGRSLSSSAFQACEEMTHL